MEVLKFLRSRRGIALITLLTALIIITVVLVNNPEYLIALNTVLVNDRALIISFPKDFNKFNVSNIDQYHVVLWAVTPEDIVELSKISLNPSQPILKLSAKDLENITKRWLNHYKVHGKYWRPALILQLSVYNSERNELLHLFGASIVYDPEMFVDKFPRVEIHRIDLSRFASITRINVTRILTTHKLTPCVKLQEASSLLQPGLPPVCPPDTWGSNCDCCEPGTLYATYALIRKLFDSSNQSIPEYLRDKVPIAILYRDSSSTPGAVAVSYEVRNVDRIKFRFTFFNINYQKTIFADPSGEIVSSSIAYYFDSIYPNTVRFIYFIGSYKLYEAVGYTCCLVRSCGGEHGWYCEPNGAHALLMIVTYVTPIVQGSPYLQLNDFPIDISYLKQRMEFTTIWLNPGTTIEIAGDPHQIRLNLVNIAMAAALTKVGTPWWQNNLLTIAVDNMPIAIEIVFSGGAQEHLKIYNGRNGRYIELFQQSAIYLPTYSENAYKWTLINVK